MLNFSGRVVLPNETPKTIGELIRAAIDLRDLTPAQKSAEKSRWNPAICFEGFVMPAADGVYMLNAFKGVRNGVLRQHAHALPPDADRRRELSRPLPLQRLGLRVGRRRRGRRLGFLADG